MNQSDTNQNGRALTFDAGVEKAQNFASVVFKSHLSLKTLIEAWNQYAADGDPVKTEIVKKIQKALEAAPELRAEVLADLSVIERHRGLVEQLMSLVFPRAYWEDAYAAAVVPFQFQPFYASPRFRRLEPVKHGGFDQARYLDHGFLHLNKALTAYAHIMKKFYDLDLNFESPVVFTCTDPATGLQRYHKVTVDLRFVEIKKIAETKPLAPEEVQRLLANPSNLELWRELIPPQCFEFHGFVVLQATEVTDQEILSALKSALLEKDAIISPVKFRNLEQKMRVLLRRPELKLGLAGMPVAGGQNFLHAFGRKLGESFVLNDACRYQCSHFAGSIYERAVKGGEQVIVEDLSAYANATEVEKEIIKQGIKNIFIAPLKYEDQLVGLLEIGSPHAGDVNGFNAFKLKEVLALFAIAIKRSLDEMNDRVEAVIKEQCTAIHPAVEWRFRRAALNYLRHQQEGVMTEMEPIVFKDVYPLYGLSDIRGSSVRRNEAIRADLSEQLHLVREIVALADRHKPLPFLSALLHRIDQRLHTIAHGISSGDETGMLEFIHREIEPYFSQLQEFNETVRDKIAAYRAVLDPQIEAVYHRRKEFEESVMLLNETISSFIEEEQEKAQAMFPHYFEKYKSDGVDHGIYIGAALVENGKFDPLYLRNIRLWQLMLICEIVRRADRLKHKLIVPLEMAHLILVQHLPLAIRFRYDEKKFDVDGAYNVRYEILKKRIDKAMIKGTRERLTQPGKIAIVYSHPREATEYMEYIDYLQSEGDLDERVEQFELEDLQGVQGLRALRVTVNLERAKPESHIHLEAVEAIVSSLAVKAA